MQRLKRFVNNKNTDGQMESGAIKVYSITYIDFSGFLFSTQYDSSFLNGLMLSTNALDFSIEQSL
ncbi:MAG: hypothetical protein Q4B21_02440 [Bacteroidia bacterium]|nr:hypothetical protein [Bacteroidia bacterium]